VRIRIAFATLALAAATVAGTATTADAAAATTADSGPTAIGELYSYYGEGQGGEDDPSGLANLGDENFAGSVDACEAQAGANGTVIAIPILQHAECNVADDDNQSDED
jgi:hypothetical protein